MRPQGIRRLNQEGLYRKGEKQPTSAKILGILEILEFHVAREYVRDKQSGRKEAKVKNWNQIKNHSG